MMVAPPGGFVQLPGVSGKTHGEESEKEACNLKPKDAGGVGKGLPHGGAEAARAAREAVASIG